MYEDNLDYAATRLVNTFVQHEGKVLLVVSIRTDAKGVPYANTLDHKGRDVSVPLNTLSHLPIPLGYVPQAKSHFFFERLPKRKWKQGIHPENTVCLGKDGAAGGPDIHLLQALLEGKYSSKEEAIAEGGAFSRSFYVCRKSSTLWYCAERVGEVVEGRIILDKGKEYLYRRLERTQ